MFYDVVSLNMKQLDKTLKASTVILILFFGLSFNAIKDLYEPYGYLEKIAAGVGLCVSIGFMAAAVRRVFYLDMFSKEAYLYMQFPVSTGCRVWGNLTALLFTTSPVLLLFGLWLQVVSETDFSLSKLIGTMVRQSVSPLQIGLLFSLGAFDAVVVLAKVLMVIFLTILLTQKLKSESWSFVLSVMLFLFLVSLTGVETMGQLLFWNYITGDLSWSAFAIAGDVVINAAQVWLLVKLCTWLVENRYELR